LEELARKEKLGFEKMPLLKVADEIFSVGINEGVNFGQLANCVPDPIPVDSRALGDLWGEFLPCCFPLPCLLQNSQVNPFHCSPQFFAYRAWAI